MKPTVLFILSSNYSGSTWLALLLGSHSRAFYVGELNKMFHDEPMPCRLCEEKRRPCPVFHDVAQLKSKQIHATVLERTCKSVIVDNSKTISWSKKFLADERFERRYIHLLRDPRAIAYSLQMRKRKPDYLDLMEKNYEIRNFLRENGLEHRVVTYNAVAEETDATLVDVCQWLGLVYEPAQKEYWNFEHHGPGRNGATAAFLENYTPSEENFYAQNKRTNFHDLRWQEQLDAQVQGELVHDPQMKLLLRDFGLEFSATGLKRV